MSRRGGNTLLAGGGWGALGPHAGGSLRVHWSVGGLSQLPALAYRDPSSPSDNYLLPGKDSLPPMWGFGAESLC